jgi:hypothetical protein
MEDLPMKKNLFMLMLVQLIIILFFVASANAYPTRTNQCSNCHNMDNAVVITTTFTGCIGSEAYYDVSVPDLYDKAEGWAVFSGTTNTGINDVSNAGSFTVAADQSYDIWGVSNRGSDRGGSNVITITPDCVSTCTDSDSDTYAIDGGSCGAIDCEDSDPAINPGAKEDCTDGDDNDCDDTIDCDDTDCAGDPACPSCEIEICGDGIDNDCDGKVDCADKGNCRTDPACTGGGSGDPEICDDGIDNDGDGKTDCADKKDCRTDPEC